MGPIVSNLTLAGGNSTPAHLMREFVRNSVCWTVGAAWELLVVHDDHSTRQEMKSFMTGCRYEFRSEPKEDEAVRASRGTSISETRTRGLGGGSREPRAIDKAGPASASAHRRAPETAGAMLQQGPTAAPLASGVRCGPVKRTQEKNVRLVASNSGRSARRLRGIVFGRKSTVAAASAGESGTSEGSVATQSSSRLASLEYSVEQIEARLLEKVCPLEPDRLCIVRHKNLLIQSRGM